MISALESQSRASRPARAAPAEPSRISDVDLVLADAHEASLEIARDLAPSLRGLEDVGWIERTIEMLPMMVLRAASGRPAALRDHLEHAQTLAVRLRVAIEVLDGMGVLGVHPTRVRARACGIHARLRDAARQI